MWLTDLIVGSAESVEGVENLDDVISVLTLNGQHLCVTSHHPSNRRLTWQHKQQQEIKDLWHIWSIWSVYLRTYIWGRFSVHLRPILYRFSIHLRQNLSDWLRHITWQNKLSLPQMYRESASNVQNSLSEPIRELYIWGQSVHFNENVQIL